MRWRTRYDSTVSAQPGSHKPENRLPRSLQIWIALAGLVVLAPEPVSAQYRRQAEELVPPFAVSLSAGALFSYDEITSPVDPVDPDEDRRGVRSVGTTPAVSVAARYGRGIAIYAHATVAFGGEVELSGFDALTGAPLDGTEDRGTVYIVSAGASFAPLRDVMGLRLEAGPALLDLGNGGSYIGIRVAASARFLDIGNSGGVLIAWDGYFAGGQYDREDVEFQVKGGLLSGARLGYELRF